jgi:hypothetical protein
MRAELSRLAGAAEERPEVVMMEYFGAGKGITAR